jgi:hypothetical protein
MLARKGVAMSRGIAFRVRQQLKDSLYVLPLRLKVGRWWGSGSMKNPVVAADRVVQAVHARRTS